MEKGNYVVLDSSAPLKVCFCHEGKPMPQDLRNLVGELNVTILYKDGTGDYVEWTPKMDVEGNLILSDE